MARVLPRDLGLDGLLLRLDLPRRDPAGEPGLGLPAGVRRGLADGALVLPRIHERREAALGAAHGALALLLGIPQGAGTLGPDPGPRGGELGVAGLALRGGQPRDCPLCVSGST